jgi:hypothetical protein
VVELATRLHETGMMISSMRDMELKMMETPMKRTEMPTKMTEMLTKKTETSITQTWQNGKKFILIISDQWMPGN